MPHIRVCKETLEAGNKNILDGVVRHSARIRYDSGGESEEPDESRFDASTIFEMPHLAEDDNAASPCQS